MAPKRKSTEVVNRDNSTSKNLKTSVMRPQMNLLYKDEAFIKTLSDCFQNEKELFCHESGATVHNNPFTCTVMPKFVSDDSFLEGLKEELKNLKYNEKNNDLYKFKQTNDLGYAKTPHVAALASFLYKDVLEWLKVLTGIKLTSTVDVTSSKYEQNDVLLCHDDELEGRRIAYMLYLVPAWESKDGGSLDLFDTDDEGQPKEVVVSLLPQWNTFTFFEVTSKSFHQVAEITAQDKCRLSINGWFYGPPIARPARCKEPSISMELALTSKADELAKWINPTYLKLESQLQIRTKFEDESEIELPDFLQNSLFSQLETELKSKRLKWTAMGPPNKKHYEVANDDWLPDTIRSCLDLFRSEQFFLFLSSLTGLNLHPLAEVDEEENEIEDNVKAGTSTDSENKNATCHLELNRWRRGSYTLMYDKNDNHTGYGLDIQLFFNCSEWTSEMGGFMSYVAKDEDEELLTVCPSTNSLALVYRDSDTTSFLKYINSHIQKLNSAAEYHTIRGLYLE